MGRAPHRRDESVEFDIRATRGWRRVRARATAHARGFRAARRDRAFGSFRCARVPATASSRSRSCPRNTPSALRSGTLSWREIAASNARLRRRTRARGRGGSSTRRRRRTASSFDSCRTSGSGAGPKRGSLQGSSPCDRRSDDGDEAALRSAPKSSRVQNRSGRVKRCANNRRRFVTRASIGGARASRRGGHEALAKRRGLG